MFRTSLCPSSGGQDRVLLHMVFCTVTGGREKTHIPSSGHNTPDLIDIRIRYQSNTTAYTYTHAIHIYTRPYTYAHDHTHICTTYTYTHDHTHIHMTYTYTHYHTHTHTHTWPYTHTHDHTHTHTKSQLCLLLITPGKDSMAHILQFFSLPVTVQNTICSNIWSCSPDDGHNDARNMLR